MSSFPILRLPHLAQKDIVNCWNPVELYKFSRLSRKTKAIAKSYNKTPFEIDLLFGEGNFVTLKFNNLAKGSPTIYEFHVGRISDRTLSRPGDNWNRHNAHNPMEYLIPHEIDILRVAQEIIDVFKCPLHRIVIYQDSKNDKTILLVSWINAMKQESIPKIDLYPQFGNEALQFLQFIGKSITQLFIWEPRQSFLTSDVTRDFPKGIFNSMELHSAYWIQLKELLALDFVKAEFKDFLIDNNEVNLFLKSWKEGKTHLRMKECRFKMKGRIDMTTILQELSPTFTNPYTIDSFKGSCEVTRKDGKVARAEFDMALNTLIIIVLE